MHRSCRQSLTQPAADSIAVVTGGGKVTTDFLIGNDPKLHISRTFPSGAHSPSLGCLSDATRALILGALTLYVGVALAQQEGLEALRERGYVRVCADPSNLPFSSTEATTPGFEVELARLIARELGIEARMEWHLTFVRALRLRAGKCGLFMGLPADERFTEGNPD